ncbi:MAG: 1-(5-phosphoribosyl)-5-[(5-phosphoribosylamino)methylideneamino]imidazole-4-carboxamide isomerase [Acholeplasmataceae bacterium]|nr:MAG: 1-(5-phosphoribosyl)-5-[(5-phosphoribosylamino)methylideneamino]imidazole-4-carboxamide isomerase [Acholeplasmataceae bacterium]
MKLYPAIDLKDNQCVRLRQGRFDDVTIYSHDPVETARRFVQDGATAIHVVDLDAAMTGEPVNLPSIRKIIAAVDVPVQVGGGIRTIERAATLLGLGVDRIIVGTVAVTQPQLFKQLVRRYPGQVIVSVDAMNGKVATLGWQQVSGIDSIAFCQDLEREGAQTIIYTDISKDGMMEGTDIGIYASLVEQTNLEIIASGGISSLKDLVNLKQAGVTGAIIGKALYEGVFSLKEALKC